MKVFGYDLVELLGSVSRQYTILVAVVDVSSISKMRKKTTLKPLHTEKRL